MEGVAAAMGLCMRMIREAGIDPRQVVASGGGFSSDRWTQMHADAFMAPVRRLETPDGAARGAALLAAIGTGSADPRNLSADPSLPADFTPDVSSASHWNGMMTDIRAIHRAISSV
jgi:sugar (pentulose or hexulose) kinase